MVLNNVCHVLHTAITYFNVIPIKQLVIFMVFWEVLVKDSQKYFANLGLHVEAKQWIEP